MIVSSWNVLHHVHACNWGDLPAAAPDEPARIAAIAARVRELLVDATAVCLQEVSGDQLRALDGLPVCAFALPRVPRLRHGRSVLADPTEHLAVVTRESATVVEQRTFASDPGKGFVAVQRADDLLFVSTHVSYGERSAGQLGQLADWARGQGGRRIVIGGDFNADRDAVRAVLDPEFTFGSLPASSRPSRPRATGSGKSQQIDHVLGRRVPAIASGVEDGRGLSDHNPVWTRFGC